MTIDWIDNQPDAQAVAIIEQQMIYYPGFLAADEAQHCFTLLLDEISWQQEQINLYGKKISVPRRVGWYGDAGTTYNYSGIEHHAKAWTATLRKIRRQVESFTGKKFNSVLLNLYRDGRDSVAWHSDDEPELGRQPTIASVSLGAERVFQVRHKKDKTRQHQLELAAGSLLLMQGDCQHDWIHQIPKTAKPVSARINLTFRTILS